MWTIIILFVRIAQVMRVIRCKGGEDMNMENWLALLGLGLTIGSGIGFIYWVLCNDGHYKGGKK